MNFTQEGELLVDGLRRVALKRIHVVLNSADGDVLDGFISEESALLFEPASLGDVGTSSQMPLIALIEHMSIGGEGMQLFCVLFRLKRLRRLKILRWKQFPDSSTCDGCLKSAHKAFRFTLAANLLSYGIAILIKTYG